MKKCLVVIAILFTLFLSTSCENDSGKYAIDFDSQGMYDNNNNSELPDDVYNDEQQKNDKNADQDNAGNDLEEVDAENSLDADNVENKDDLLDEIADADEISDADLRDFKVEITVPATSVVYEADTNITFQAKVTDTKYSTDEITVKWLFDDGTTSVMLNEQKADASGVSQFSHSFSESDAKYYTVTAVAVDPDSTEVFSKDLILGVCTYRYGKVQTFDTAALGEGWVITKDSYHDSDSTNGWLELTGNAMSKQGAIYNDQLKLSPGDITMKIDIRTGKPVPDGNGADGFAMTVYDADNAVSLTDFVSSASMGGCLGYGVSGGYCGTQNVTAFHIEFDTWYNNETGVSDPTTNNHIAINLNGNPGGHQLYKEVEFEDYVWHTVEITTKSSNVTVKMDGNTIIDDTIPDFSFRGGYIMFSGSTGLYYNFHSVDNLEIVHECTVPQN